MKSGKIIPMKTARLMFLMICVLVVPCRAGIIHVIGEYPTIQAGIDAASDGDVNISFEDVQSVFGAAMGRDPCIDPV